MKRIFAVAMAFVLLNCFAWFAYAADGYALSGDGTFSHDTEEWYGIGCETEFDANEGCGGSGCLSAVLHTSGTGVGVSVNLRKYLWYSISLDAKVDCGRTGSCQLAPSFRYQDAAEIKEIELLGGTDMPNGEWTRIEGYFQVPVLAEAPSVNSEENLYLSGVLQLLPQCVGNESEDVDFYLDNVRLEEIDGTLNSSFEKGLRYWNYAGNYVSEPFDAEREGVGELEKSHSFPEIASVMKFMPSGNKCDGPTQSVAMESGVNYEISAWFKGENVQNGDNAFLILDRFSNSMGNFGANTTVLGRIDVSDGGWHRIKAVVNFPIEHERKSGDATVYLRIANGTRYGGNAPGRTLVIAECEIKKQENLIQNSYFVKADAGMYATDHAAKPTEGTGDLLDISEWNSTGVLSAVYDSAGTYDGSKLYAQHILSGKSERQAVWQTVCFENTNYDASVWVKLGEDYAGDTAVGFLYVDGYEPISGYAEVGKDKWTKISVVNCGGLEGEHEIGFVVGDYNEDLLVTAEEGSVLFADFTVAENHDTPVNVTSISVSGAFCYDEPVPEVVVYADSLDRNMLSYEYLLYDEAGGAYVPVSSGEIQDFKSGEKLPALVIYPEWAGMKLKIAVRICNRSGEYGEQYLSEEYLIKNHTEPSNGEIIPFSGIFENEIENGKFEQGIDGWQAENKAELKWENDVTADNSVGSLYVRQTNSAEDGAGCDFRIRRYRTYRFSADVRMENVQAVPATIQAYLKFDNNGTEVVSGVGTVAVNDNGWNRLEKEYSLSSALDPLQGLTVSEDMYREAKLIFKVSARRDAADTDNFAEFYIDNVTVTEVNGIEGTLFDTSYDNWKKRSSALEIVNFSPDGDGVGELAASGDFPDVRKCLSVTGAVDTFCEGPEQRFYVDADVPYELSVWVKAKDARRGDHMDVLVYRESIDTYSTHGRVDLSDGRWHHIKAVITSPSSDLNYKGDMQMFTRFTDDNQDVFSAKPLTAPRTFYMAEFSLKKLDNLIANPYFIRNGIYWRGNDYNGLADVTGWQFEGKGSGICDSGVTYDGAAMYGEMQMTGRNDQSVGYAVSLEKGTPYQFSVWVKTENVEANGLQLVTFVGDKSNVICTQSIPANQWSRVETEEFVYGGDSGERKIGFYLRADSGQMPVEAGNLLFESAKLKPVTAVVPEITASLSQVVCGADGNAADVKKVTDIAMGYRCNYYLSDNKQLAQSRRIVSLQMDINEQPAALYGNLGWKGKYICAGITPVSRFGVYGKTVYTDWAEVCGGLDLQVSVTSAASNCAIFSTEVDNNFNQGVWADFIYVYSDQNGAVKKIRLYKEFLEANKKTVYTTHRLETDEEYSSGNITVYTWLGAESGLVKFAPLIRQVKVK